jgi:hypothetical protein
MADITPGEANVQRDGAQINLREARAIADEAGTVRGQAGTKHLDRDVTESPDRPNIATSGDPAARGAGGGAGNAQPGERSPDEAPFTDSETALGGADAVQKTTYGVGHGTEPIGTQELFKGQQKKGNDVMVARVATGGGVSPVAWLVGILGVLALLVYAFGAFRS